MPSVAGLVLLALITFVGTTYVMSSYHCITATASHGLEVGCALRDTKKALLSHVNRSRVDD